MWVRESGKQAYLGGYASEEEAAEAHDVAALKCHGLKAKTNFHISRCVWGVLLCVSSFKQPPTFSCATANESQYSSVLHLHALLQCSCKVNRICLMHWHSLHPSIEYDAHRCMCARSCPPPIAGIALPYRLQMSFLPVSGRIFRSASRAAVMSWHPLTIRR